jgi:hypothetical protein
MTASPRQHFRISSEAFASLSRRPAVARLEAVIARAAAGVSDNGTELTGMAMLRWSQEMLIECVTSHPASCSKTLLLKVSMAGSGSGSLIK